MVTPDFNNKINPVRKDTSVNEADTARKPPEGDFDQVAREVDERESGGNAYDDSSQKDKKKSVSTNPRTSSTAHEDAPLLSPFQLARGYQRNNEDQQDTKPDVFEEASLDVPKPKKTYDFPQENPIAQGLAPAPAPFEVKTSNEVEVKPGEVNPQQIVPNQAALQPLHPQHTELKAHATKTANSRYNSIEQSDLTEVNNLGEKPHLAYAAAYVPPVFAVDASMTAEAPVPVRTPLPLQSIQEVVDQIVEKVYTLKQTGETQVIVDLKGSFAGSRLTVTESDSAKGQLNITIDNLTGPNQALIEAHKAKIMDTLLESGVQVQRFTASTTIESPRIDIATRDTQEQRGQGQRDNPKEDNPRDRRRQQSNDKT